MYVCVTFTVSVPEVQVPVTEKTKSKQELSRNEHLAAVKHEGELFLIAFMCTLYYELICAHDVRILFCY